MRKFGDFSSAAIHHSEPPQNTPPPSAASNDHDLGNGTPSISWPVNRPREYGSWDEKIDRDIRAREQANIDDASTVNRDLLPGYPRALSGIAIRAFLLGFALAGCSLLTVWLAYHEYRIWRAPQFIATLSLFHFLEFYITAAYNTPAAKISSFLLFNNGREYTAAHTGALIECLVTSTFLPTWQSRFSTPYAIMLGLALIVMGQTCRSVAMAQAGTNFNHTVQRRKNEGHELVTSGLYAHLRHPSYFGFFWWALGTQVVIGNKICLVLYAYLLWQFFYHRIRRECYAVFLCRTFALRNEIVY
ncbi:hypothetical protein LTR04_006176 [Oleoguttula sp. CCFEE 6159]|nr:hypothetical protein LTR04_006176 [Oleoguttula sp. CCFEE 6159]